MSFTGLNLPEIQAYRLKVALEDLKTVGLSPEDVADLLVYLNPKAFLMMPNRLKLVAGEFLKLEKASSLLHGDEPNLPNEPSSQS